MNGSLKTLIDDMQACEQKIADQNATICTLKAKANCLRDERPEKSRRSEQANLKKEKVLAAHVMNQATESELEVAREEVSRAQKDLSDSEEIIEATYRAAKRLEDELPKLHQAYVTARIRVWQTIASNFKEQARAALGDKLVRAYVAAAQCGTSNLQGFLSDVIGIPPADELNQIRDEIEHEYLGGCDVKERKRG